ncbi:DUF2785 domain-containing protein [Paenibacillus sp. FSL K6-1558]|uniref:DUF2785 domain-containing protein n=1 Tax=Paenibacillus sp. FSL K6-1558 TaxID=2921473 RepID=UPI0030F66402
MNDLRAKLIMDLQRIEAEDYHLREGEYLHDILPLMLRYIGDPHPELRDELIYPTFYNWIQTENLFSREELCNLLNTLIDEQHLFYHIGNVGDETVFTRTFSALPIALIIRSHRQNPFLNSFDFIKLKNGLLRYYKEEKDLRGYVPQGGWAHSAAHGADMLVELIQCPESDSDLQLDILNSIQNMLENKTHIFSEEEDERMTTILDTIIEQSLLSQKDIISWINGLVRCTSWPRNRGQVISRVNVKNFLRSLYFRRSQDERDNNLVEAIRSAEMNVNKFAKSRV